MSTDLLEEVKACTRCRDSLPYAPKPILQFDPDARILIAGQAPGRKAHESGLPFNDPSGDRLRRWMGITREVFYDSRKIAILPMGFCFPGSGKNGDLPPRPECADMWREALLAQLNQVQLTLVIGRYAMAYHLPDFDDSVTEAVRHWRDSWPACLPLPHPSPRNQRWLKQNPWFESDLLPLLKQRVAKLLTE